MVVDPFIKIVRTHEGWSSSTEALKKIIKKMENKYGYNMFPNEVLGEVKKFQLYNIAANLNICEQGIENMLKLTPQNIDAMEERYINERIVILEENEDKNFMSQIQYYNKKCKKLRKIGRTEKLAECLVKLAKHLEQKLTYKDFIDLVGEENIYFYSTINGFRKNAEYISKPIHSNTKGEMCNKNWNGPIESIVKEIGIKNGEFEGSWLREVQ